VFTDNFDSLSLAGFRVIGNNNAQLVNAPIRAGSYSAQLSLSRATDSASGRTELLVQDPMFDIGGEYWIGFSNFFPSTTQFDDSVDIVFNLHARPDAGEDPEGAPVSLRVQSGEWRLVSRSDPAAISTPGSNLSRGFTFGAVETNRWNDWVFHIKLSPGADGLLEVWKDGIQVVNFQGPTTYNDQRGPFMKMGIYKPLWRNGGASASSQRTINIDEVKIGDSSSVYAEIAPDPSVVPTTIPGMVVAPVALPDVDDAPIRGSVSEPVDVPQVGSVPEFASGTTETVCNDLIDDDGDGLVDLNDSDCAVSGTETTETVCNDLIDDDGDGLVDLNDSDCLASGTSEVCGDFIDNDGDALVDEDC
jgi:hypothetical protein